MLSRLHHPARLCARVVSIPSRPLAPTLVESAPNSLQPYMRLMRVDKPIGSWLLFWPCSWSIGLSAPAGCLPDPTLLALFGAGSFLMRGAGCVVNDLLDRDLDRHVERTRTRPLASGELSPLQGLICLAGLLSASLLILLQLNYYSIVVGASSLVLVGLYPLTKRYTYWPQAVLGITLNWGILISWAHAYSSFWCILNILPLYGASILYTVIYDTIYSHQDRADDLLVGVKSTALLFGDMTKPWLCGFGASMSGLLCVAGLMAEQTWPYYAGVGAVSTHIAWQILTLDINNASNCWARFTSNRHLGLVLFLAIVAGNLNKEKDKGKTDQEE